MTNFWEENQSLAAHVRDQLAQYEAGLMDLREALNYAVNTTREADELNSRNQERLKEALVGLPPVPASSPLPAPLLSMSQPSVHSLPIPRSLPLPSLLCPCHLSPMSP